MSLPKVVPGVKPGTVVSDPEYITRDVMVDRITKSINENGPLLNEYHELWYKCGHTWPYNHFLGVGAMKSPNDLWMYQLLMAEHRPLTVIETGTYQGASALWFAFLMDMLGIDGKVFTVDFEDHRTNKKVNHPRISYLAGNSVDEKLVEAIAEEVLDGPLLISLDSDHTEAHVKREMELYAPLCSVGDFLIVEDTNIGWTDEANHSVSSKVTQWGIAARCSCGEHWMTHSRALKCPKDRTDRGARGGVEDYLRAHEGEFIQDVTCERFLLTMNPGGWLRRVAECNHAS